MIGPHSARERGQVVVLFALLIPMLLALGAFVVGIGNWYTHAKNLQTKADASALAGGGVWSFPCVETTTGGPTTSQEIANEARIFVGPHIQANGIPFVGTTFNEQVGHVPGSKIHVVLNGSAFYDNDSNPLPAELNDPSNPSICNSKILDVKVTEDDTFPLLSLLPLFPDIKRKARVQIEQVEGLNNLLPIAVRVPEPLSAAAVFYDEGSGTILQAKYMCKKASVLGLPPGLGGWAIVDTGIPPNPLCTAPASFNTSNHPTVGVAVALSTRPACDAPNPPAGGWGLCMDDNPAGITNVSDFCRQAGGNVKCFYATGSGTTQTVQSGLQFIHGYGNNAVGDGAPELRSVYFDGAPVGCGNYFSITVDTCTATLHAAIDYGSALDQILHPGAAADVKYGLVYGNTTRQGDQCMTNQNPPRPNCDMTGSTSASATATFDPRFDNQGDPQGVRHSIAIRVRLRNTTIGPPGPGQVTCPTNTFSAICEWYFTGNGRTTTIPTLDTIFAAPVQRSFVGDDTISGPIKWTRLAGGSCGALIVDGEAASQPFGNRCFDYEMGLKGALATDQDEPAFAFNFKGSQSGAVDCDDGYPNWKTEVLNNCRPFYQANDFSRTPTTSPSGPCPWPVGTPVSWNTFMNPPAPYNVEWPPYTCLRTDGPPAPGQVNQGLDERLFPGQNGNNVNCPQDSSGFVPGRNYWDDSNNASGGAFAFADLGVHPNHLKSQIDDRRLVTLFLTTYDSFTGNGGATYPIVGFANFYITGWGKATGKNGLQIQDPCPGNDPPPDLVINSGLSGAEFVWGHFVNAVAPEPFTTGGNGILCRPEQFQPCVAVLVE
jgi:hypothetical protein